MFTRCGAVAASQGQTLLRVSTGARLPRPAGLLFIPHTRHLAEPLRMPGSGLED